MYMYLCPILELSELSFLFHYNTNKYELITSFEFENTLTLRVQQLWIT